MRHTDAGARGCQLTVAPLDDLREWLAALVDDAASVVSRDWQ